VFRDCALALVVRDLALFPGTQKNTDILTAFSPGFSVHHFDGCTPVLFVIRKVANAMVRKAFLPNQQRKANSFLARKENPPLMNWPAFSKDTSAAGVIRR
jgi:hypothetical protein